MSAPPAPPAAPPKRVPGATLQAAKEVASSRPGAALPRFGTALEPPSGDSYNDKNVNP